MGYYTILLTIVGFSSIALYLFSVPYDPNDTPLLVGITMLGLARLLYLAERQERNVAE